MFHLSVSPLFHAPRAAFHIKGSTPPPRPHFVYLVVSDNYGESSLVLHGDGKASITCENLKNFMKPAKIRDILQMYFLL